MKGFLGILVINTKFAIIYLFDFLVSSDEKYLAKIKDHIKQSFKDVSAYHIVLELNHTISGVAGGSIEIFQEEKEDGSDQLNAKEQDVLGIPLHFVVF